MVGAAWFTRADDRLDDLHRRRVEFFLHGIGAVVAGATLDHLDARVGDQRQRVARLGADVLHALVAGRVMNDCRPCS